MSWQRRVPTKPHRGLAGRWHRQRKRRRIARFAVALAAALGDLRGCRVLDVACGTGIVTSALARSAMEVVGIDLTPEMLKKAEERCAGLGLSNVRFLEGQTTALPFDNEEFDVVVTRLSIHHFLDPKAALAEMTRVLRPGGRFALIDVVVSEDRAKAEIQNAIEVLRDPSHVRMLPTTELRGLLQSAGLHLSHEETWDKPREFEEWVGIVANPQRVAPVRTVARALANAGEDAGMGLRIENSAIVFFHRWHLMIGRKV